jgi:hypothetical protein
VCSVPSMQVSLTATHSLTLFEVSFEILISMVHAFPLGLVRADELRSLLQGYSFLAWMRWQGLLLSAATERHVDHAAFINDVSDRRTAAAKASMPGHKPCAVTRGLPWHACNLPAQYPFRSVAECLIFCLASKEQPRVDGGSRRAHIMLYFLWDCGLAGDWQVCLRT